MRPVQPLGTPPFDGGSGLAHIDWIRWWGDLAKAVENVSNNTYAPVTPSALTRANDTNVTVTLTGSPTVALLAPVLMTLGWTGTLAPSRGGTGTGTAFTAGSVIFAGPLGVYAQDNANLFWDDTNNRLGIGTNLPFDPLTVATADASGLGIAVYSAGAGISFKNNADTIQYGVILSFTTGAGGILISTNSSSNPLNLNQNAGPIGVGGVTSPTARLHIAAGTTAAGKAPIKLNSGSLLTTAEAGAVEFLTDAFYATITTGPARKQIILESLYTAATALTMNTARLLGRTTAGVAAAEEISVGINLSLSAGVLSATTGGLSTFVIGDLLYANSTTTLARLADVAVGSVLISGGVGVAPSWSANPFATTLSSIRTALAAISTDGLIAENTTASTALAPIQISPRLRFRSHVWNTGTLIDNTDDFWIESLPQSSGTPLGVLTFKSSLNGAAATTPMTVTSSGGLTTASDIFSGSDVRASAAGAFYWNTRSILRSPATGQMNILNFASTAGIGFDVTTDATIKIRTRAQTGDGSLTALNLTASGLTSGRVTFAGTGGLLSDDADLTFATDTLTATKLSAPTSVSTGTLAQTGKTTTYNNVATAGWGEPAIYGSGRSTAQVAAVASVAAYTCGAADGSFIVSMNVNVTTSTTHNFTAECAYTDETNTARVLTMTFSQLAGVFVTAITNVTGAGPYEGVPMHIRVKASTAITLRTQAAGTYTIVTYNVEGLIEQVA